MTHLAHQPPSTLATSRKAAPPNWPALALCLALISPAAWPHGGETHDDAPPTGTQAHTSAAPQGARASARTDTFELVAVWTPGDSGHAPSLTVYLDKADTNEPVPQASIDVESGAFKATASPVSPGVYSVPAAALAKPGRYPLTFTVQTSDSADLLDATLVTPSPQAADTHDAPPPTGAARWPWLLAGATLLAAATWISLRRATRARPHADRTA